MKRMRLIGGTLLASAVVASACVVGWSYQCPNLNRWCPDDSGNRVTCTSENRISSNNNAGSRSGYDAVTVTNTCGYTCDWTNNWGQHVYCGGFTNYPSSSAPGSTPCHGSGTGT